MLRLTAAILAAATAVAGMWAVGRLVSPPPPEAVAPIEVNPPVAGERPARTVEPRPRGEPRRKRDRAQPDRSRSRRAPQPAPTPRPAPAPQPAPTPNPPGGDDDDADDAGDDR